MWMLRKYAKTACCSQNHKIQVLYRRRTAEDILRRRVLQASEKVRSNARGKQSSFPPPASQTQYTADKALRLMRICWTTGTLRMHNLGPITCWVTQQERRLITHDCILQTDCVFKSTQFPIQKLNTLSSLLPANPTRLSQINRPKEYCLPWPWIATRSLNVPEKLGVLASFSPTRDVF